VTNQKFVRSDGRERKSRKERGRKGANLIFSFLFLHSTVRILGSPTKVSGQKR
jgi:hypothetical protein